MSFIDSIIYPFEWFVATIMVGFEWLLTTLGMQETNGWTWVLSIVGLVIVLRILLIPLFVRQIKSQRRMQMIQPELQKIQKKYKGKKDEASRKAMTEESMALYKRHGTNPFSSCLPILLQAPFFFGLFRMLNTIPETARGDRDPRGFFSQELAGQMNESNVLGASLSSSFLHDTDDVQAMILSAVLIVAMSATMFITQHQLMRKNMPATSLDNPMARQQKMLMYAMPIIFGVFGVNFPLGVLFYWTTTNLWTMGQQFFVIRAMPAPGSPAEKAREERRLSKGKPVDKMQMPGAEEEEEQAAPQQAGGQRVQPKSKKRAKGSNKSGGNRPKGR